MLRRILTVNNKVAAPIAPLTTAARRILFYSEQNKVLSNNQEHKGYATNVWVPTSELDEGRRLAGKVKDGEQPTEVMVRKTLELWNASQLFPNVDEPEPEEHTSLRTNKPYGRNMQKEMELRNRTYNFESKLWMTKWEAKNRALQPIRGQKTCYIPIQFIDKLYNADQLVNSEPILTLPVSGQTKSIFVGEIGAALTQRQKEKGYPTGLWFGNFMLRNMALDPRPGEDGLEMASGGDAGTEWYNIEQLVDYEQILEELNRSPTSEHTFLLKGVSITSDVLLPRMDRTDFKSKYWISKRDIDTRHWTVAEGASSISGSRQVSTYFNVAQLTDPTKGFTDAGLYVR